MSNEPIDPAAPYGRHLITREPFRSQAEADAGLRAPKATPITRRGKTRIAGAKKVAELILQATEQGADFVQWALDLWKDTEAPLDWRWKAFEWLTNRGLGTQVTAATLIQIGQTNKSPFDLAAMTDADLERIDAVFREVHGRKIIEGSSVDADGGDE